MKYKIAVITGSRAEYGLLRPVIKKIDQSKFFELQLIVTGTHLSPEFGQTENEIYLDNYKITDKLEILLSSNTRLGMAKSTGLAIISFADSYKNLCPDLVVCLGDRYEIFSAVYSALIMNIPIAHIHGGELTYGAIDDQFRHAITKASSIHFPCTEIYKKRIIQMGEESINVHNVGALGVERVKKVEIMTINEMEKHLGVKLSKKFFLVTVHAPTKGKDSASFLISQVIEALEEFPSNSIIMSYANQDSGGYEINKLKNIFCDKNSSKRILKKSLGHKLYINLMRNCTAVIGNSSSGVIESPILGVPSINIGSRQNGRYLADSVIQVKTDKDQIILAMKETINKKSNNISDEFGTGGTSDLIIDHIKRFLDQYNPSDIKKFNDIAY